MLMHTNQSLEHIMMETKLMDTKTVKTAVASTKMTFINAPINVMPRLPHPGDMWD